MGPRTDWESFDLYQLPVSEVTLKHVEACAACAPRWIGSAIATHEATHCAVALGLNLRVEFVAIDDEQEIEVTDLEAQLYPLVKPGTKIPAIATRLNPDDLRRQPKRVLVAMVAPSCVVTGNEGMDRYATLEAEIAARWAKTRGYEMDEIFDWAQGEVEARQDKVLEIAARLAQTGWVDSPK